ncbi:MAG TPA: hypothetical protein VH025_11095, partial [Solirubrobacteraceae bacterium]|nr:hypothetical protein [Solirubrobacteraceae bacterium]
MTGLTGRPQSGTRRPESRSARRHTLLALLALSVTALLVTPAGLAATPADTAATHALLQARYMLDRTLLQGAAAERASSERFAAELGRQCHGVLSAEPPQEDVLGPPKSAATPRARGEQQRSESQRETIDEEIGIAVAAAGYQPVRAGIQTYLASTGPLSWSDPRIAQIVHADAAALEELATATPPDACADMKAWAQSGYRSLSPASRAFAAARAARNERVVPETSLSALLKSYEGPAEFKLERQTAALSAKSAGRALHGLQREASAYSRLQQA